MRSRSTPNGQPSQQLCIICEQPCSDGSQLCSRECALDANREIDDNVAELRRRTADSATLAALAARNGYLTSALLQWDPEPVPPMA